MNNSYQCSAAEWEFARYHSMIGGHKRGYKSTSWLGCLLVILIPFAMIILYYVLQVAIVTDNNDLASKIGWIKNSAITVGIVIGLFYLLRSRVKTSNVARQSQSGEVIDWIVLDDEGITLNIYHNLTPDIAPKILWTDIKLLSVDITKDLTRYSSAHKKFYRKMQDFDRIRSRLPEFKEPAAVEYFDRFTLLINIYKRQASRVGMIAQLPRSWITDGTMAELLQEIESRSSLSAEPYDEESEHYYYKWLEHIK
ncbi:hypothetical protein [Cohnella sp. AR92]|uniref:hypothetical protein n=1 Tax=Cohnella sp. AR92 TaxID=648716 RepID=UPI000F8E65BC|nr:hypothetical protein [Cohnella sp. AR92]RUS44896.1 hypothetical protein ELR57_21810 [Cohnella sp. AR92]